VPAPAHAEPMNDAGGKKHDRFDRFLEVGIWLVFFALLVPAGLVGYEIGKSATPAPAPHVRTL
jgi:hypothetical protein